MSVSSTPGVNEYKPKTDANGIQTPRSLSDEDSIRTVDDESDVKPDVDDKKRTRQYRYHFIAT
jgi:hypothetical protein